MNGWLKASHRGHDPSRLALVAAVVIALGGGPGCARESRLHARVTVVDKAADATRPVAEPVAATQPVEPPRVLRRLVGLSQAAMAWLA
jgi:hypothetical protein